MENERKGLSQSADQLREQYEKKIAEMKERHADEIRKIREEYERRIKDDSSRHQTEMRDQKSQMDRERDDAL